MRICPRKTIKPTENKTTQPQNGAGAKAANIKQLPMELMGNESITAEISSMQKMTIKIKLDKKKIADRDQKGLQNTSKHQNLRAAQHPLLWKDFLQRDLFTSLAKRLLTKIVTFI